jgi:surfeit locus 1 family protein
MNQTEPRRGTVVLLAVLATLSLGVLLTLGTWQVQRLQWKEALIATIDERMEAAPRPLNDIETQLATTGDIEYWPIELEGTFRHEGERHFFATHQGASGYFVYTPFELERGRFLLVNRGFVPFDRKDPATRADGQVDGVVSVRGLVRERLAEKPSFIVPENDPAGNVFYWKDLGVMAETSGVGAGENYLPFFVDADAAPNPGGLPVGGVTIVDMPNNHLQYAVTWYGLALALTGVTGVWLWRRWRLRGGDRPAGERRAA